MLTKKDLEFLADTRLDDAVHLFHGARYSAAYYLSGYTVELAIKACIAGVFHANVIPDKSFVNAVYSHKLDDLLLYAGAQRKVTALVARDRRLLRLELALPAAATTWRLVLRDPGRAQAWFANA